jgi:hypothetical protein
MALKLLLGGRRWMQWTVDKIKMATKTSLQTPTSDAARVDHLMIDSAAIITFIIAHTQLYFCDYTHPPHQHSHGFPATKLSPQIAPSALQL